MHNPLIANLATFLCKHDLVEKTISEHQCRHGDRCSCSTPNVSRPWPCTSHRAAVFAARSIMPVRRVG